MPDDITAATAVVPEVTEPLVVAESPEQIAERISQEHTARLEEAQAQLAELQANLSREATARAEAEKQVQEARREATQKTKEYQGLQRESTAKLQELALLRQQLANNEITDNRLQKMERLVNELANNALDPERVQQISREIEIEQMKRENENLKKAQAAPQSQAQESQEVARQPLTPEYKKQLKDSFFGDFPTVDAEDLTDDEWYGGTPSGTFAANEPEWKINVRASFSRHAQAHIEKATNSQVANAAATARAESEAALKALKEEQAARDRETKAQIDQLTADLAEQRRLSEEQLNRKKGMDRSDSSTPSTDKRVAASLSEIPDEWLYGTPEQRKAYKDALNNPKLRNQIIEQSRAANS